MQNIIVRSESPEDIRAIDVVNLSAFEGEAEAKLVSAIRELPCFIPELSLVAEFNSRIVGHLLLSKVRFEVANRDTEILALAPMSVVPSQSHRGIGADLIEAGIARARDKGFGAIVVVVRRADAAAVAQAGEAREAKEAVSRAKLAAGELSLDLYDMRTRLAQKGLKYV